MRAKYVALALCFVLGVSALSGCSKTDSSDTSETKETVYGEITEIGDSVITIETGTLKENDSKSDDGSGKGDEATSDDSSGKGDDAASNDGSEAPSMLELTGETQEITVTDDTTYTRQSMGGMGGQRDGNGKGGRGDGEQASGAPDGEMLSGAPDGEQPSGVPDGEMPSGAPDEAQASGQPDKPDGESSSESEEITLDDLSEGDTISVSFDEDGNAAEITVLSGGGMGRSAGQTSGQL
ncbi:MAG: hypothetical protein LUH14_09160 [Clostridiaceae bacterium]|nr:hypothetical protein [Clostridiaceae bacterium]